VQHKGSILPPLFVKFHHQKEQWGLSAIPNYANFSEDALRTSKGLLMKKIWNESTNSISPGASNPFHRDI